MALQTSPSNPPVKIGPPIGARRSSRIQAAVPSSTKVQPSHGAKAHHHVIKPMATRSHNTAPENNEASSVAQHSTLKPHPQCSSQGLTCKAHKEEYLNSFHTKIVMLKDGTKLDRHTALEQLHRGTITLQDIDNEDGHEQSGSLDTASDAHPHDESQNVSNDDCEPSFPNLSSENVSNDQSTQSEEDEQVVEDVVQSEHAEDPDLGEVNHASDAEDEHAGSDTDEHSDSNWSATKRGKLKCEQTAREILAGNYEIDTHPSPPLDFPTSSKDTTDAEDTNKYRKPRGKSVCILTNASEGSDVAPEDGLGTESNLQACRHGRLPLAAVKKAQELGMHTTQETQAIADEYGKCANPKTSDENLKDYYCHQMKHYKGHKEEEQFPDLWAEIHKFWSESISGTKDMSSKAMAGWLMTCRDSFMQAVQTWCNVENIHIFRCVIYSGNDEAACQAQGIFAGSSLCMQLASERQTDITRLLDYLTTIVKYKHLDSTATVPLPAFAMLPGTSYDHTLLLKPQESRHDRIGLSPEAVTEEVGITHGQKNVPWKTLLDLLFAHKYTIVDWPGGVPAVSQNFNVKHLNANEHLCFYCSIPERTDG
ncbi:hypothetical protein EDC04DRAFT_2906934 [Pisolithus marmoratus]|nr:hypothetical protein EDC04DRAFT_2906934 [Pisolithus marmoratus]